MTMINPIDTSHIKLGDAKSEQAGSGFTSAEQEYKVNRYDAETANIQQNTIDQKENRSLGRKNVQKLFLYMICYSLIVLILLIIGSLEYRLSGLPILFSLPYPVMLALIVSNTIIVGLFVGLSLGLSRFNPSNTKKNDPSEQNPFLQIKALLTHQKSTNDHA